MADGIAYVAAWHFINKGQLTEDVQTILMPGEQVHAVYRTVRDIAVLTDRRLVVRDAQGITGKKVEIYSIPWRSVVMWSSENSGKIFDIDAEIELWTLIGRFKINLDKKVDIREIDALISQRVLSS